MERDEITRRVRSIVMAILEDEEGAGQSVGEIDDDDSLIDGGLIDSVNAIRLIEACHESFDIVISPAELSVENFDSIERISNLVRGKVHEAGT